MIFIDPDDEDAWQEVFPGLSVKEEPKPEIPPPCWDDREISPSACVAATRALCG